MVLGSSPRFFAILGAWWQVVHWCAALYTCKTNSLRMCANTCRHMQNVIYLYVLCVFAVVAMQHWLLTPSMCSFDGDVGAMTSMVWVFIR